MCRYPNCGCDMTCLDEEDDFILLASEFDDEEEEPIYSVLDDEQKDV